MKPNTARVWAVCLLAGMLACDEDDPEIGVDLDAGPADAARPPPDAMRGPDMRARPSDDFGEPCEDGADCQSSFCVVVEAEARVCTRLCGNDDDCPDGWICRQVLNAGADVAFVCVPEEAPCAGADLRSDPENCGACGQTCSYPGADALCAAAECAMGACEAGFHDVDGDPANGCEYACLVTREGVEACDDIDNDCDTAIDEGFDLATDVEHCGACGQACEPPNAEGVCAEGVCGLGECAEGFQDLDDDPSNGCELGCTPSNGGAEACDNIDNDCDGALDEDFDFAVDLAHCGACNQPCQLANADSSCVEGVCRLDGCRPDFYDRDGELANGCEVGCQTSNMGVEACDGVDNDCDGEFDEGFDLAADPLHCGGCGQRCDIPGALTACREGACGFVGCAEGFVDLDGEPANGCEYACGPANGGVEICDDIDDDCDGEVDEGFDLQVDVNHCGRCGSACGLPNAAPACVEGRCEIERCEPGFVDLDGRPGNGCELRCDVDGDGAEICDGEDDDCDGEVDEGFDLSGDPTHCGACGAVCALDNAAPLCAAGRCRIDGCEDGFVDLDDRDENGCECAIRGETCDGTDQDCDGRADEGFDLNSNPLNCGACNNNCELPRSVERCQQGECRIDRCEPGWFDVDEDDENGCECFRRAESCNDEDDDCDGLVDEAFDLDNDPENCGGCGNDCAAPRADTVCRRRSCAVTGCDEGFVDLDGDAANGCELDCARDGAGVPECGAGDFDYEGLFVLAPRIFYGCSAFGEPVLDVEVRTIEFGEGGGVLLAAGAPGRGEGGAALAELQMTQNPNPEDGSFNARASFGAVFGCNETFTLSGDFTDPDTFEGTFRIQFNGDLCAFTTCADQRYEVTGARR